MFLRPPSLNNNLLAQNVNSFSFKVKLLSCVWLSGTPWTVAYQASPSMGFSRQEYWSGLPFLSPGDLPDPGIKPGSPALRADALLSEPGSKGKASSNPRFEPHWADQPYFLSSFVPVPLLCSDFSPPGAPYSLPLLWFCSHCPSCWQYLVFINPNIILRIYILLISTKT